MGFVYLVVAYVVLAIPAYILAQRLGLAEAWAAFIPLFGVTIVVLRAIDRTAWFSLITIVPLVNVVFSIWLFVTMPAHHGRTRWWALALLIPFIGLLWYALTLPERSQTTAQPV
jgi:hypothetical protein